MAEALPAPEEVEVRYAEPEDWALVRDVRLRSLQDSPSAFASTHESEAAFTRAEWVERCRRPAVLALASGRPVAVGSGFEDEPGLCRVVAMWTDPAWRGQGLAGRVLDLVLAWAHERDLRAHLDVAVTNRGARRVYERHGFRATGDTRPIRAGSEEPVEHMLHGEA
jgi:RimJ/RimL family protein N-acetyltransferase